MQQFLKFISISLFTLLLLTIGYITYLAQPIINHDFNPESLPLIESKECFNQINENIENISEIAPISIYNSITEKKSLDKNQNDKQNHDHNDKNAMNDKKSFESIDIIEKEVIAKKNVDSANTIDAIQNPNIKNHKIFSQERLQERESNKNNAEIILPKATKTKDIFGSDKQKQKRIFDFIAKNEEGNE